VDDKEMRNLCIVQKELASKAMLQKKSQLELYRGATPSLRGFWFMINMTLRK
jgi:hypothetical protein